MRHYPFFGRLDGGIISATTLLLLRLVASPSAAACPWPSTLSPCPLPNKSPASVNRKTRLILPIALSRKSLYDQGITLEHSLKELLDVVSVFGRDLPAVDIKLLLVLLDCPLVGDLALGGEIGLIADNEDSNVTEVDCLIFVTVGLLAHRSQASMST